MSTHFAANYATSRKFRVTGSNYIRCGEVGVEGNNFGTHLTLHFEDGDYANFKANEIEEAFE